MCKHILITSYKYSDSQYIERFLELSQRETDGYGFIIRDVSGKLTTYKDLGAAQFYLKVGQWLNSGYVKDIVIHHRTSTNEPGLDYAHPFEFQGNYLTHNGVVSVPGTHMTKTKNDSEALLHHLIKTGYDTKSISGYFSCFILNKQETIVLVDGIAPMYTNGRVFSSHDLSHAKSSFRRIEKVKMTYDGKWQSEPIEVTESSYGWNQSYLSLGGYDYDVEKCDYGLIESFYDTLQDDDMEALFRCNNYEDLKLEIDILAGCYRIPLTRAEVDLIAIELLGKDYSYA